VAKLAGVEIDGVVPTYESINDGSYKPSREMFVYVKKAHVGVIPGLDKFAFEYVSEAATGEDGYLGSKGLVTLPRDRHEQVVAAVTALEAMKGDDLK
jgi:phosphate transport system substrate-binding protein